MPIDTNDNTLKLLLQPWTPPDASQTQLEDSSVPPPPGTPSVLDAAQGTQVTGTQLTAFAKSAGEPAPKKHRILGQAARAQFNTKEAERILRQKNKAEKEAAKLERDTARVNDRLVKLELLKIDLGSKRQSMQTDDAAASAAPASDAPAGASPVLQVGSGTVAIAPLAQAEKPPAALMASGTAAIAEAGATMDRAAALAGPAPTVTTAQTDVQAQSAGERLDRGDASMLWAHTENG